PTISRFDNQSRYDINTLASISRTLGVTIDELFTIEENNLFRGTQRSTKSNKSLRKEDVETSDSYHIQIDMPDEDPEN
ncbi:MAG TPA: hypothetical protein VEV44_14630, partial [Pseudoneobacillus sp.]|nr:hypothetical protein [Pseudoneobacillus sp.]